MRHVRATVRDLGAVQIDAVNVLVRSHYLPLFSRLGAYDRALFDRLAYRDRRAFETLAHAASFVPIELHGALRWRMDDQRQSRRWTAAKAAIDARNPGYLDGVLREVAERGPLAFNELTDPARRERPATPYAASTLLWWGPRPSDGKHVLEGLWREGVLAVAGRTASFERRFDLAERVLPEAVRAAAPSRDDAQRQLVLHAARALGVAWLKDLADFFRLPVAATKARVVELVDAGQLLPARIDDTDGRAYLVPNASTRPVAGRALLSPFDSLLWERERNVRLFGFRHSFEIYVPEAKRTYGYYVLPFLLGDRLVARIDLKSDRQHAALR
ncbi:MAG TPA: crosslink repair DNA glycosylase YcaQ family protein, partial [Acidimicrobiales bacterium]|nr:crosslink repair DNA glycosylase YcaQ family protein [Acidimicrobiales bacterium]